MFIAVITINRMLECPLDCGLFSALDFTAGGEGEHSGFTVEALVKHGRFLPRGDKRLSQACRFFLDGDHKASSRRSPLADCLLENEKSLPMTHDSRMPLTLFF